MTDEQSEEFCQAIEQFNHRDFYACHDTLEAIWIEAPSVEKNFYQVILQVAVALYHLGNHNWRGAVILLGEGLTRLHRYLPEYGGVDLDRFVLAGTDLLTVLQQLGADRVGEVVLPQSSTLEEPSNRVEESQIILPLPIIRKVSASVE